MRTEFYDVKSMLTNPKHRDNAFDLIRFLAALAVLFSHSFATSGMPEPTYFGGETAGSLGVFVFFSVSGYLVQQSWARQPNASSFVLSRVLRIFPGLIVCLFFCAFVLGPIATSSPWYSYFLHKDVYKFVYSNLVMFFVSRFDALPGVFVGNAFPSHVNSSLWTIRFEVFMYVALLAISLLFRRTGRVVVALLLFLCIVWFYGVYVGLADPGQLLWRLNVMALDGRILKLAPFFLMGVLIAKCPQQFLTVWVAGVAFVVTAFFYRSPNGIVLLWFALPYCLTVIAYNAPNRLNKFGRHGDFSYGLYLYAFPVQQVLAQLNISTTNWWAGFFATFVVALTLAVLSWKFVESPTLRMRSTLMSKIRPTQ